MLALALCFMPLSSSHGPVPAQLFFFFFQTGSKAGWKVSIPVYFLPEAVFQLDQISPAYLTTWTQVLQQGHSDSWPGESHRKGQLDGTVTGQNRSATKCQTTASDQAVSWKCSVF